MVYFRECPQSVLDDDDALDFVFKFANEYTEESIRNGYQKGKKVQDKKLAVEIWRKLRYSMKDILSMSPDAVDWGDED